MNAIIRTYKFKILVGTVAVGIICSIFWNLPVWPFYPVFLVRPQKADIQLRTSLTRITVTEANSLACLLRSYNEAFFIIGGVVFVKGALAFDAELRWNYSSKAGIKYRNEQFVLQGSLNGEPDLWIEKRKE